MTKWIIIIILIIIAWFILLLLGSLFNWHTLDFDIKQKDVLTRLTKNKKYFLINNKDINSRAKPDKKISLNY
ncbi:MAG: hypothetical protein U5L76_03890 [Patescibacteria group bacterium]|nr:hypothetical protein [Patescibacteria group bacterium]